MIRVLVVDDSSFMRNILARLIAKDGRFEVVGTAKNGVEGVQMAMELKPDVVTMDIEMPMMDGLQALDKIMSDNPRPVVMVSALTEAGADATLQALEKGAVDFIPKALEDDKRSVFNNFKILADKVYAASRVQSNLNVGVVRTPVVAQPVPEVKQELKKLKNLYKIMVVGSSTGGPRALNEFIPGLPANMPMPIIIGQHMPEKFTAAMAERLDELSQLKVMEVKDGQKLEAGAVYVCPGGVHTKVVKNGDGFIAKVGVAGVSAPFKPSIDFLGDSAYQACGKSILAVMLTGMGSDGAMSFAEIKQAGGYVIAQDEATSVVYGMPKAVVQADGATEVVALGSIAERIVKILS